MREKTFLILWFTVAVLMPNLAPAQADDVKTAAELIRQSGVPGGICSVIGDQQSHMTLAAGSDERFVVQALYTQTDPITNAREAIRKAGFYGRVSADLYTGPRLPYTDNLINLVIAADHRLLGGDALPMEEIMRILAPLGSVYIKNPPEKKSQSLQASALAGGAGTIESVQSQGKWLKITKAWPTEIDEWSHFLHGADGNPVAQDTKVGPPKHSQWLAGPAWAQSHESDTSLRCLVTAQGRIYYILNEAPTSLAGPESPPDKWFLQARDAFNGVLLWKHPITEWGWREWKPSWFTPRPGVIPLNLDKRLVASGQNIYVTLGFRAPVSEIDGRTGKVLRTFEGTDRTSEILCLDNSLVLTVLKEGGPVVKRVDLKSGRVMWSSEKTYQGTTVDYYRFTAMGGSVEEAKVDPTLDLAANGTTVALVDGDSVAALDLTTGKERWHTTFPLVDADSNAGNIKASGKVWNGAMIVSDGVVLHASPNQLAAFSAETGKVLWQQPKKFLQHLWYEWQDVFVIDGLVWTWSAEVTKERFTGFKEASSWPVSVKGYDLHSGEVKRTVDLGKTFKANHHHRCYRNKATLKYIIASRRGSEFVDLNGGEHSVNNWVRGACHMGMMPANGLQYAPPHPCQCYADEMLNGLNALTAARPPRPPSAKSGITDAPRLIHGAAFSTAVPDPAVTADDWPIFRGNAGRSGSTPAKLPERLKPAWQVKAGKKVGAAISVGGRVFVPLIDEHQVLALSTEDGRELWRFTAGGRIDSSPTYDRGALVFGCADGRIYRVRADDGALIWSLRGGPSDLKIGSDSQLESVWPVSGSVLVDAGTAYFAAGRASHLDGGIRMIAADAATGEILHEQILSGPDYDGDSMEQNFRLPMGWVADILFKEADSICMRTTKFDSTMTRQSGRPQLKVGAGFLDDSWFKRMPWAVGKSGHARVVVYDDDQAYCLRMFDSLKGLDPKVYFTPGKLGYLLFSIGVKDGKKAWEQRIPIRGMALASTANLLCVAGSPDVVSQEDPLAAFEGRLGGILRMLHKSDGAMLAEYSLESPPVFNGIAIANRRLFLSLEDGSVACFTGAE